MSKIVNLKPIFDSLVVEQLQSKKQTESGIIIPESSQKKPNVYKVTAVGPTCKSGIREGDYVVLPKNIQVTTDIEVNGNMVAVVKEENVIAIVNVEN